MSRSAWRLANQAVGAGGMKQNLSRTVHGLLMQEVLRTVATQCRHVHSRASIDCGELDSKIVLDSNDDHLTGCSAGNPRAADLTL